MPPADPRRTGSLNGGLNPGSVRGVLLVVAILAAMAGGCANPGSPDGGSAATKDNPAFDRMGALAGIPAESDVPSGGAVLNPAPLLEAGRLAGANAEAGNLKTAARTYLVDHPIASRITSEDLSPSYVGGLLEARYYVNSLTGLITRVDSVSGGWTDMVFSLSQQKWGKGTPDNDHADDQDVP